MEKARCSGGSAQRALSDCSPRFQWPGANRGSHRPVLCTLALGAVPANRPYGLSLQPVKPTEMLGRCLAASLSSVGLVTMIPPFLRRWLFRHAHAAEERA